MKICMIRVPVKVGFLNLLLIPCRHLPLATISHAQQSNAVRDDGLLLGGMLSNHLFGSYYLNWVFLRGTQTGM